MAQQTIGKYRVESRLGAGSFATVWLAYDADLDARVAIKVLAENWANNDAVKQRFLREARILLTLDSPFIVRIFTTGWLDDGRPYFVMEYGEGGSLEERMRQRREEGRRFSIDEAVALSQQIAEGLIAAHAENIIHRDLKPNNILLRRGRAGSGGAATPGERLMLVDFGIARQLEQASGTTITGGTLGYAAPEQFDPMTANQVDARSDVYAAATILYELLAGQLPFPHGSTGQLVIAKQKQPPPPITTVRPDVPRQLADIIAKGLAAAPAQRFPSAQAWSGALKQIHTESHPIRLDPAMLSGSVPLGTPLMFTATIPEESGEAGATLIGLAFSVTGANPQTRMVPIGGDGAARFSYAGTQAGIDTVLATMNLNGQTVSSNAVSVPWGAAPATRNRPGLPIAPLWAGLKQRQTRALAGAGAAALLALVVALLALWPKSKPLNPQGLFQALLDTPVNASELPAGFSATGLPYSHPAGLGDAEKQFHALWEVEADVAGPAGDAEKDGVYFDVFPTEADAHAFLDSNHQKGQGNFTPSGFGKSLAFCFNGRETNDPDEPNKPYGFTACDVLVKNVFVQGSSHVFGDKQQGNQAAAIAMAQFGAAHLQKFNFREGSSSGQNPPATGAATTATASRGSTRTPTPVPQPAAPNAQALLTGLQNNPVASEEILPPGLSKPQPPAKVTLSDTNVKFHAAGQVNIALTGPSTQDSLGFVVFATAADAQADFKDRQGSDNFSLPGSSYPSTCYSGNVSSASTPYGFTECLALMGNSFVYGESDVNGSTQQQGNRDSVFALTQFAVAHLQYVALLNSVVDSSELPRGFSSPQRPAKSAPVSEDSKFHAVGEVSVSLSGPDSEDALGFVTFLSAADAQADFKGSQGPNNFTLPGSSYPSTCYSGSGSAGSQAYGFTQCVILVGNMYLFGNSRVNGSVQQQGNRDSAFALTQLAAAHVQKDLPALPQ